MTPPLFLVDVLPGGDTVVLDGDEGRHALVKRLKPGEEVLVGDGRGTVLTCAVVSARRDTVELTVTSRQFMDAPIPRLVVVQALPKGDRADLAVELMTELGADEIVPWQSAHAIAQWDGDRGAKARARWQRTAREAAKQSRRAWVPIVSELASTDDVVRRVSATAGALVLHEAATTGLGTVALDATDQLVLIVGPEGGISPAELSAFTATGAVPVRLGESVLRTSTAGGAALAALNLRLGRWR